ncbi:MAG: universal stress protein [Firmicutes bacterium]|nr:universal stress protein [Bacillota bacterium]
MKILVCTDGSKMSMKATAEAVKIVNGCSVYEVDILHVYSVPHRVHEGYTLSMVEEYKILEKEKKEQGMRILAQAAKVFDDSGIPVNSILEDGHPAETIIKQAAHGGYDMVVVGSRGLGGLKKMLLGSVSQAVVQEVSTNVLIVK